MTRWIWLAMLPALAAGQNAQALRGAEVFRTTCAVAYCHGAEGRPGRAPALAGSRLSMDAIAKIVTAGIPNTSMPGFGRRLGSENVEAVAAYIVSLRPKDAVSSEAKATAPLDPRMQQGRSLFFDAARTGNCGACHEVGDWGTPVSLALQDLRKARLDNLRAAPAPNLVTAKPAGEDSFPAVVVEKTAARVRVYDVSSPLPVLRDFALAEVTLSPGASWRHASAAALYTDSELETIAVYLKSVAGQQ